MKIIQGDLIKLAIHGRFDVIIHGCNCFCVMGGGIAKTIKGTFPEAYQADRATVKGSLEKLGNISSAIVEREGQTFTVVNGYTQFYYRGAFNVDYDAICSVMKTVKKQFSGRRIGYPLIGAGLADGDWAIISKIIEEELAGEDHTLVEFSP